jgi:hypothetical protein
MLKKTGFTSDEEIWGKFMSMAGDLPSVHIALPLLTRGERALA